MEFLVGTDVSMRSLGGCSLKRPDKFYMCPNMLVEVDECDEHQHSYRGSGGYTCEEQRITELYDEPSIVGNKMVVIRWNPDSYEPPQGVKKLARRERLKAMVAMKRAVRAHPPPGPITVIYMFYSASNPQITRRLPRIEISSMQDIEAYGMAHDLQSR
jgi:hypothetical protein